MMAIDRCTRATRHSAKERGGAKWIICPPPPILNFCFWGAFSVRSILCMGNLKSLFWGKFFIKWHLMC